MKHHISILLTTILFLGCTADAGVQSHAGSDAAESLHVETVSAAYSSTAQTADHIILRPDAVEWQAGPASFEEGSEVAVIEGDPSRPAFFNLRIKMPDGFRIAPHFHSQPERVTIISGTFVLGEGEVFDAGTTHALEAGSYFAMPPGMVHYATTRGETVVQLTSIGPWNIEYVNPDDDPRLR